MSRHAVSDAFLVLPGVNPVMRISSHAEVDWNSIVVPGHLCRTIVTFEMDQVTVLTKESTEQLQKPGSQEPSGGEALNDVCSWCKLRPQGAWISAY